MIMYACWYDMDVQHLDVQYLDVQYGCKIYGYTIYGCTIFGYTMHRVSSAAMPTVSQPRNRSITPLAQLTQPLSRKYDQNNLYITICIL